MPGFKIFVQKNIAFTLKIKNISAILTSFIIVICILHIIHIISKYKSNIELNLIGF